MPCLSGFCLDLFLPRSVLGPVLFSELLRFDVILFSDIIFFSPIKSCVRRFRVFRSLRDVRRKGQRTDRPLSTGTRSRPDTKKGILKCFFLKLGAEAPNNEQPGCQLQLDSSSQYSKKTDTADLRI